MAITFCLVLGNSIISSTAEEDSDPCKYGLVYDEATESCTWADDASSKPNSIEDNCEIKTSEGARKCTAELVYDAMIDQCVPKGSYYCDAKDKAPNCSDPDYQTHFIADKANCANYYYCDEEENRYKGSCPSGYIFNPIKGMCSHADSLSCTAISGSTGDSSSGDDNWSKICGNTKNDFIVDERVCTAYIYCNDKGKPTQDFCPFGTYFVDGSCVKTPPNTCSCEVYFKADGTSGSGTAPHKDIHKYYKCNAGSREEKTCAGGAIWDAKEENCMFQS